MKVGILTYHFSNNYGAVLQTYALQSMLSKLGHSTIIINRTPIKRDILHRIYYMLGSNSSLNWTNFSRGCKRILNPITSPFTSDLKLEQSISKYKLDAIVAGSDQIWRGRMCGRTYFLEFLRDDTKIRRISYAASFGLSKWENYSDTDEVNKLLHKFNHISVREQSGVEICKNQFNIEAQLVLDPTLLFGEQFYIQSLLNNKLKQTSGKVVSYILGKKAQSMVLAANQFAAGYGLKHKELYWLKKDLSSFNLHNFSSAKRQHITIEEWLTDIRDAEYVITNSFHCVVFSILFHKKFVVFSYEAGGNDRLVTLLNALGLENHICRETDNFESILQQDIDYAKVEQLLRPLRDKSMSYLNSALQA